MNITILQNAHIYTGNDHHPWAHTLALVGDKVVALDQQARAWATHPDAIVEDLNGATVLPGLMDAHIHFMWYALGLSLLDLLGCSRQEMLNAIAARAQALPPGKWITGRGWDQNIWEDTSFPTAAELDRVSPQHPVLLSAKNGHAVVANSAAMRVANITTELSDPPYGKIGRNTHGVPNGLFFERATHLVRDVAPPPTLPEVVEAMDRAQDLMLALGLTGVHDVDGGLSFAALQTLHQEGRLRIRVVKYVSLEVLDAVLDAGLRTGLGDDQLRFGGLKLYADGALGARTGAMLAPYEGEPDNVGILTMEPENLRHTVRRALDGGLALAIHAIGDQANRIVLDAMEAEQANKTPYRHRIEHVQLITPEDQRRLGQMGIVASMQPVHAIHDQEMADRYWGARTTYAYAWRSIQDAGAVLAFGSDAPIERIDPFPGLYAAVTRRSETGQPGIEGWHPEQRLTLTESIRGFTWGAAYAAAQEKRLGMLLPGYYADLIVLDRNIFELPSESLLATHVQRTMVGGKWMKVAIVARE